MFQFGLELGSLGTCRRSVGRGAKGQWANVPRCSYRGLVHFAVETARVGIGERDGLKRRARKAGQSRVQVARDNRVTRTVHLHAQRSEKSCWDPSGHRAGGQASSEVVRSETKELGFQVVAISLKR